MHEDQTPNHLPSKERSMPEEKSSQSSAVSPAVIAKVKRTIEEVAVLNLPPEEFWQMVEERLGVEHGDAFEALLEEPALFGLDALGMIPHRPRSR
jgi:hypothetical protein